MCSILRVSPEGLESGKFLPLNSTPRGTYGERSVKHKMVIVGSLFSTGYLIVHAFDQYLRCSQRAIPTEMLQQSMCNQDTKLMPLSDFARTICGVCCCMASGVKVVTLFMLPCSILDAFLYERVSWGQRSSSRDPSTFFLLSYDLGSEIARTKHQY